MNCDMFAQMLDNYADLTDADMRELETHAEMCEGCNADLVFMRSILGTVNSLPPIDPPSDFLENVNARLDAELAGESMIRRFARRSKPYVYRYGAIAACAVLTIGVGMNADMLLSKMNNDSSGVITEERITDIRDDEAHETADDHAAAEPEALNGSAQPAHEKDAAVKTTDAPVLQTPKPLSSPAAVPSKSGSAAKRSSEASSGKQTNTAAESASSNRAEPAGNKDLPVTSPAPQPSATENIRTDSTPVPNTDAQPAAKNSDGEKASVNSEVPETVPEQTPADKKNDEKIIGRAAEPAPYSIDERARSVPDEYVALAATEEPSEENFDALDYSIAYSEMDNTNSNVTAYAPLSSMVSIKSKDAARVQELVDVFVSGVYENYYMINTVDMRNLLGQFDREGIWYSANIKESDGSISFRLVIIPSD
ncbi:MAG: hypothetical protein Q4G33_03565 [bacterium]|nr:hypothetical protein [bacterium]